MLATILLIIYAIIILTIGIYDAFKTHNFKDYVLAGKKNKTSLVTSSLLATVIGASATLGVIDLAVSVGFPAFWWLASGSLGLLLAAIFLTPKLKKFDVYTLPDLASKLLGAKSRELISLIIIISWIGIIAAQFVAAAKIISGLTPLSYSAALIIASIIITCYCLLGGQTSILKTDLFQFSILFGAITLTAIILYHQQGLPANTKFLEFSNESFSGLNITYFLFIIGSGFMAGPDIFSRIFTAKDSKVTKRSLILAAIVLLIFSFIITMIGIWAKYNLPVAVHKNILTEVILNHLPVWLGIILSLGLLSAIISSADTCLMTVCSSLEYDIIKHEKIKEIRFLIIFISLISFFLAFYKPNIISLLLMSYNIFNAGVIPALVISIVVSNKYKMNTTIIMLAIIIGGSLGIIASILNNHLYALAGFFASTLISLVSLFISKKSIKGKNKIA